MRRAAHWSGAEVDQLRDLATKVSVAELVRKMGRSRGAIAAQRPLSCAYLSKLGMHTRVKKLIDIGLN